MDLHPGQIGYHPNEFNWIYSHFEQYFWPGRIRPVEFEIRPVEFDRARNTA